MKRKQSIHTYFGRMVKIKVSQRLGQIIGLEIRGRNTRYIIRTLENEAMVESQFAGCEFELINFTEKKIGFNES